jgi:hypothetical protein
MHHERVAHCIGAESDYIIRTYSDSKYNEMIMAAQSQLPMLRQDKPITNKRGFAFVVHSVPTDANGGFGAPHIMNLLTVIDLNKKQIPFSIFINFVKKEAAHRNYRGRYLFGVREIPELQKSMRCFDGSVSVQLHPDDRNCGLYAPEFSRVLSKLLENNDALQTKLEDPATYENWDQFLKEFHLMLMKELPQFFNATPDGFAPKPWEELKPYFVQRRWDVGRMMLAERIQDAKKQIHDAREFLVQLRQPKPEPQPQPSRRCSISSVPQRLLSFASQAVAYPFSAKQDKKEPLEQSAAKRQVGGAAPVAVINPALDILPPDANKKRKIH